ncbi:hypothetical protein XZ90_001452 [Salmonella enterica subsp. enterica]|nr:hypothetical protein [Salmonella enterica subsp. enterica serovar Litchfield]EDV1957962.1 hypothetical protein [Salmonella enterica subsp. enterica serovar Litchfield]
MSSSSFCDPTPKSCSIQKQNSGKINTPLNGGGDDKPRCRSPVAASNPAKRISYPAAVNSVVAVLQLSTSVHVPRQQFSHYIRRPIRQHTQDKAQTDGAETLAITHIYFLESSKP